MRLDYLSSRPKRMRQASGCDAFMACLLGIGILLPLASPGLCADEGARPNIIFLLTDDQRWDALGCMGNKIILTPNIDRLASESVIFRNNFCTTAICAVSRASILTGQYARRHGIDDFQKDLSEEAFAQTYPALLRAGGYRTGFIGKYGVGTHMPKDKFDYWEGFEGQGTYMHTLGGNPIHLTSLQTIQAETFLNGCVPSQPFCLSISFKAPHVEDSATERKFRHDPALNHLYADITIPPAAKTTVKYYELLPEFIRNSEGHTRWVKEFSTPELFQESAKGYYRLISGVDETVGRIRDKLESLHLEQNTIIIFTSDNGFFLGERELEGKWLMYEESIRTPLIIYDPRLPKRDGAVWRDEMTLNIDLAPTILDIAGLPIPPRMQGRSLRPLLDESLSNWRTDWFYEHLFDFGGKIPRTEGIRTPGWKYTRYLDPNPPYEELFDLRSDPDELNNLAASSDPNARAKLDELRAKWQTMRRDCE